METADSDFVDTPEATTPGPGSSVCGSGAGVKRRSDGHVVGQEQALDAATPGDCTDNDHSKKKKRTSLAGRGVANLTPEQLAKKRANDREAQRAIRERTKNQIDALERRIEELTNLKPYRELQTVVRAKEAVERENADIKRQLASIMDVLKSIVGTEVAKEFPQHRPINITQSPGFHPHFVTTPTAASSLSSPAAASSSHPPQQDASPGWTESRITPSDGQADPAMLQLHNQRLQLRQGLSMGGERLGLDFLLRPGQQVNRVHAATHGAQDTPQYRHVPMKHDGVTSNNGQEWWTLSASRLPPDHASHDVDHHHHQQQQQQQQQASGSGSGPQQYQYQRQRQRQRQHQHQLDVFSPRHPHNDETPSPLYSQPIKNSKSTCPLDTILLNFLSERRQRIAEGLPIHEVIGPRYPSVSSLLNPANAVYSHPLSKVFTDILARFPGISRLPERIAVLYVMFLVMRWRISPTRENYQRLPAWMTPRQSQLDYAHPVWIDDIPFPAMRERLARIWMSKPGEYELEQFFIPYTTTLRVSWPYEETDALLILPDCDDVVINPVFERHLRNIENWKLGESFARAFPDLADTCGMDPAM